MSLSDKRTPVLTNKNEKAEIVSYIYPEEDVKESMKNLIKKFKGMKIVSGEVIEFEIRQEVGEELLK